MVTQTAERVKTTGYTHKLFILRDVEAIVLKDQREAERNNDQAEVDRCQAEMELLERQVNELTNGRGY